MRRQRGVAAVEFALVFPVMFLLFYGLLSYGALLFTQIAVSRAVEDGARALAVLAPDVAVPTRDAQVRAQVIESLAATAVAARASNGSVEARRAWLSSRVTQRITVSDGPCIGCVTVALNFPYADGDGTRLFPSLEFPLLGGTRSFLPTALVSRATVLR